MEKYPHWLCGDFLDFFTTSLGPVGTWNPVDFYGGALTEEYTHTVNGTTVQRQFLERGVLQRRNDTVEILPVGILYVNWVRQQSLTIPDNWKEVIDASEVTPSR